MARISGFGKRILEPSRVDPVGRIHLGQHIVRHLGDGAVS